MVVVLPDNTPLELIEQMKEEYGAKRIWHNELDGQSTPNPVTHNTSGKINLREFKYNCFLVLIMIIYRRKWW